MQDAERRQELINILEIARYPTRQNMPWTIERHNLADRIEALFAQRIGIQPTQRSRRDAATDG